jgi:hypothetical protein
VWFARPLYVTLDPQTLRAAEEAAEREAQSAIVRHATRDFRAFWTRIDSRREVTP